MGIASSSLIFLDINKGLITDELLDVYNILFKNKKVEKILIKLNNK